MQNCGLYCPGWSQNKIEGKRKERQVFQPCYGIEKNVVHKRDVYTNCNWCSWYSHRRISTRTWGGRNNRMSGDNPSYCILEIVKNTEKSPGDVSKLVVTQIPVKDHHLTQMWKIIVVITRSSSGDLANEYTLSFQQPPTCQNKTNKKNKYLEVSRKLKNLIEDDSNTNNIWSTRNNPKELWIENRLTWYLDKIVTFWVTVWLRLARIPIRA